MGKRRQPADQQILHTMTLQCLQDLAWIERTAPVVTHDSWLVLASCALISSKKAPGRKRILRWLTVHEAAVQVEHRYATVIEGSHAVAMIASVEPVDAYVGLIP